MIFTLCSNTQKRVYVLTVGEGPVLLHVAAASDPVVSDGQVEDQAAVPCRVLEIALDSVT